MKKTVNRYRYVKVYDEVVDKDGKHEFLSHNTNLYACHERRDYLTKKNVGDLPEYYCDVWRYAGDHDLILAKGVKGLHYKWVKENHFMKDSVLYISYTGNIEPYFETFSYDGKELTSCFPSYRNADEMIWGYDILKFLAYVRKYSDYDITDIKNSVIEHFSWLNENEPAFAPELNECKNYDEWFEKKMESYN